MKRIATEAAYVIPVISLLIATSVSWAAKAPLSEERLEKEATHIVTGKVVALSSKVQKSTMEKAMGVHRDKVFMLTVRIDSITKGKEIKVGDKIKVVAWEAHTRIPPLPGLQGHDPIPKENEVAIFYLKRSGTFFEPLLPNGIQMREALRANTTVTLKDGSRLLGQCLQTNLKVTAGFGEVTIPLVAVASLEMEKDGERVTLVTHAGDVLHGFLDLSVLEVATLTGRQQIELRHLKRAQFTVAHGEGLGAFLIGGETAEGLRTQFVKDVPDDLAAGFERVVRKADTMGSVASRHGSARWLYPVNGAGEAPRVLLEDGKMLYPIWGAWRQRWRAGWVWYDEDGTWMRGIKERDTPHHESIVEYLVVPQP